MIYTGSNGAEARDWYNQHAGAPAHETWFISKSMTTPTGNQAWRYIKGDQHWPDKVRAALYDPKAGTWSPIPDGTVLDERLILV